MNATRSISSYSIAILISVGCLTWHRSANAQLGHVEVEAGSYDRTNALVSMPLNLPLRTHWRPTVELVGEDGKVIVAQRDGSRFKFVLPELAKSRTTRFEIREDSSTDWVPYKWTPDTNKQSILKLGDRSVLQYMHEALDESSKENRERTYKVYHHVFKPDGSGLLTKGPGGLYSHHRGLFFGYNRIRYTNMNADIWHCGNGESQVHRRFLDRYSGPVFGGHKLEIDWRGQDSETFVRETRILSAYCPDDETTIIDFDSYLKRVRHAVVELDGDPQHAGVQFRASQQVADSTKQHTYYIRPDGKDKPGSFRNWSAKENESPVNRDHVDLPWHAMCFKLDDEYFTCVILDHPQNPTPARHSERDYGRFGSYIPVELNGRNSEQRFQYRFIIRKGEMTPQQIESFSLDYVFPLATEVSPDGG